MGDSIFDVFGEHTTRKFTKNVLRQPLCNENLGKTITEGPVKPNELAKKAVKLGEPKKSFLSNAGKVLQSTPARQVFTPKVKTSSVIYTEEEDELICLEKMEFTKPSYRYNTYYIPFDDEPFMMAKEVSPPATPPRLILGYSMDHTFNQHGHDAFNEDFNYDFSMDSLPDDDLGLPNIY